MNQVLLGRGKHKYKCPEVGSSLVCIVWYATRVLASWHFIIKKSKGCRSRDKNMDGRARSNYIDQS